MNYQNLAYCRFLHIWMTFYFLNLISFCPIFSICLIMFIFYNFLLHIYNNFYHDNINIFTLHFEKLPEDDLFHSDDTYLEYLFRVWGYLIGFIFLHMPNYFVD